MQVGFDTAITGKCAQQAQYWLRKSTTLFLNEPGMFPGDEDNGSMGAWYMLNALGLYPLSPASGNYTLGSPVFARVEIPVGGGATLASYTAPLASSSEITRIPGGGTRSIRRASSEPQVMGQSAEAQSRRKD